MREMMLLIKQNKGIYLTILAFLAVFSVKGTMFLQLNPAQRSEMYTIIVLAMLMPFTIGFSGNMDMRKKEFEEKLPVKKLFLEMSGYIVTVAVGAVCTLLSVITSLWMDRGRTEEYRFAGMQGQEFACLCLEVLATITFFYLVTSLFRQYIRGFCLALVCWIGAMTGMDYAYTYGSQGWTEMDTGMQMVWLTVLTFVMIVLMILHSKYRELSKGKNCYFKVLDIGVIVLLGYIVYNCFEWWIDRGKGISLLAAVAAVVAGLFVELYEKKEHIRKLQVTSRKEVKRPFLSWELGGFLIGGAILTLVLLGNSVQMQKSAYVDADYAAWIMDEVQEDGFDAEFINSEMECIMESELPWKREVKTAIMIAAFAAVFFVSLAQEGEKGTKEFREKLPFCRREIYITKTLLQIALFIVPLILDMVVNVSSYITKANAHAHVAEIYMLYAKDSMLWAFVLCGMILAFIGIVKLMDAVVENLWLKQFNLVWIVFGSVAISIKLYPLRMDGSISLLLLTAIAGIMTGLIFTVIAGKLYEKRNLERGFYYYKPALYVFTSFYSIMYAVIIGGTAYTTQNIVWCILTVAGVVGVWWTSVHFCSVPGDKSLQ